MIKPLIFEFQEYKEALKVARNLPYTKLPTDESSMESGHSDTDEEEQLMYQEVLYEKKAIIEGRRNLSSYTDLNSDDDDDWFLAKVIGNKRQVNDKDGGSLEGEDEDTDEDGGDENTAEDDANCEETDDSETDSSEKGEPLLSW